MLSLTLVLLLGVHACFTPYDNGGLTVNLGRCYPTRTLETLVPNKVSDSTSLSLDDAVNVAQYTVVIPALLTHSPGRPFQRAPRASSGG